MTREEFKKLYNLLEDANPGNYEYDGEDVISTHIYRGIWVSIINDVQSEGKESWSECYDLRQANGQLWERHVLDLRGKQLEIIEEVQHIVEKVFSPDKNTEQNNKELPAPFDFASVPQQEITLKDVSVSLSPKDILRLDLRYFSYGDGKMAFAIERHERNFITEKLLKANLLCFGDFKILGYSKLVEPPGGPLYTYDAYHTDLPKLAFDAFLKEVMDEEDYAEIEIKTLFYDEYDQYYDDDF